MDVVIYVCLISSLSHLVNGFRIEAESGDSELMTYYDVKTHRPFRVVSIANSLRTWGGNANANTNTNASSGEQSSTKSGGVVRRIGFRSNGCTCQELTCGCCAGLKLDQFNFNREGCMNFTYDPYAFSINMNMIMDGNSIYTNSFSAKNPPPLCLPVPIPYLPLSVEACAKVFDVYMPGQNLHMCFDFETRVERATVLVLHFDCMRMGNDGVALEKPGAVGRPPSTTDSSQVDADIYDEVTEIKKN